MFESPKSTSIENLFGDVPRSYGVVHARRRFPMKSRDFPLRFFKKSIHDISISLVRMHYLLELVVKIRTVEFE